MKNKKILILITCLIIVAGIFLGINLSYKDVKKQKEVVENNIVEETEIQENKNDVVISNETKESVGETIEATENGEDLSTTELIESSEEEEIEITDEELSEKIKEMATNYGKKEEELMQNENLKDYLEKTNITEAENKKIKSQEVFQTILKDYKKLLEKVTEIKEKADEQKEYSTSALMDDYILDYSKIIWMLKQKEE